MTQHKATPDQWAQIEQFVNDCGYDSCLLELRDRLAATEQRIGELQTCHNTMADAVQSLEEANLSAALTGSTTPATSLVAQVNAAMDATYTERGSSECEAEAAILAVAAWFDTIGYGATASILRQEVRR